MALPVTITGLLVATTNVESFSRPFISSAGNVYVFGKGTTTNLIRAFKATDPTSSFSNVGSDITVTSTNAIIALDAVQQGDLIHVITTDGTVATTIDLRYHVFDMSSDTWTTTNETIVNDYAVVTLITAAHAKVNIRSNGDVIVLYNGPLVNISAADRETVYYARRVSGTWTTNVEVSNAGATNWFAGGIVLGASDRMHFFFIDDGASDGYQRCLTSSNSLQTFPSSYDTSINTTQISAMACGASYVSGGTTKVRYPQEDNTGVILLSVKLDSADTPTVSTDADITGATDIESGSHRGAFAANGTTLWNVFVGSADSDIYTQSNADDGGWSTPASFAVENSNGVRTSVFVRGGNYKLAMVYNSNSNTLYNEKDLGSAGSDWSSAGTATASWTGTSTVAASLSFSALASVTWTGNGIIPAAYNSAAVASVTWTGTTSGSIASAAWNSAASSAAFGGVVGASVASNDWSSTAVASVTWNEATIDAQDWRVVARFGFPPSSNKWDATSTATGDWNSTAVASVTWSGAGIAITSGSWGSSAAISVNGTGASIASGNWGPTASASLSGDATSSATAELNAQAVASPAFASASASIAAAAFSSKAIAKLSFGKPKIKRKNIDGSGARKDMDEEDIPFMIAVVSAYREQNNVHY